VGRFLRNLFTPLFDREYLPSPKGLFFAFQIWGRDAVLTEDHRHASEYGSVGVLFCDLWAEKYSFQAAPRAGEAERMYKHLKKTLFSSFTRWYDPEEDIRLEVLKAAGELIELLYCKEEELPRYLAGLDRHSAIIASWRLRS
jgi:hypothetical protein